jgi:parallel beta-helix repeat protein
VGGHDGGASAAGKHGATGRRVRLRRRRRAIQGLERLEERTLLSFTPIAQPVAGYTAGTTNLTGAFPTPGSTTSSITDGTEILNFSSPLTAEQVPFGPFSPTWGVPPNVESATPRILTDLGGTGLTITLSRPASTFGFELSPAAGSAAAPTTATFLENLTTVGTISLSPVSPGGALLFAASTNQAFTSVVVNLPPNAAGFAIAQPRYALASSTLSLTKTVSDTLVNPGGTLTYGLAVNNAGPDDAVGATVSDPLPANTTFASVGSVPVGWTESDPGVGNPGTVTFTNPALASGAGANFTINVTVAPDAPLGGVINDAATATSATSTPVNSNPVQTTVGLVVTNTNDSGVGSLRQVILSSNGITGLKTITFKIPGTGPFVIQPPTALPALTTPADINGATQGGFSGTPIIVIDGSLAGTGVNGLQLAAGAVGSTIQALDIENFGGDGIDVEAPSVVIVGNYIGVGPTGESVAGNGVGIVVGSSPTTIGGTSPAARNVISGNAADGVMVTAGSGNLIEGNFVGTDATGTLTVDLNSKSFGNATNGVELRGATATTIGGAVAGAGNLLSNNGNVGVGLSSDGTADHNVVEGNLIGTDVSGTKALGNKNTGLGIADTLANTIGGTTSLARNIISGNGGEGIFIGNIGSTLTPSQNQVLGNYIGTDITGTKALGNAASGILLETASNNTIGGTTPGAANVISGNGMGTQPGISLSVVAGGVTSNNVVEGNLIGTDPTGTAPVPNSQGVVITDATSNAIGGTGTGAGNTIAFNSVRGVYDFSASGTTAGGNQVVGNTITHNGDGVLVQSAVGGNLQATISGNTITSNTINGVYIIGADNNSVTGNTVTGNQNDGVKIQASTGDIIGGAGTLANVISGNTVDGVEILGGSSNITVQGNLIGTDATGTVAQGNGQAGLRIFDSSGNTIGGTTPGLRNVISGNTTDGVLVTSDGTSAASNNVIAGNLIGTNSTGTVAIGNADGVVIANASGNTVGSLSLTAHNTISGNSHDGVLILSTGVASASNNLLEGNFIGTDSTGMSALGNLANGVEIRDASSNTVGFIVSDGSGINTISGNALAGVLVDSTGVAAASNNVIQANYIGVNFGGSVAVPNMTDGVKLQDASGNTVGGPIGSFVNNNVIGGNAHAGVDIVGTGVEPATDNLVQGNAIGTNGPSTLAIGNGTAGVLIVDASNNTVGGDVASGTRNVISGNAGDGVFISTDSSAPASGNVILGNLIGTDATGLHLLGNGGDGVGLDAATGNFIGGFGAAGNVISANKANGVNLAAASNNNLVQGNMIGTNLVGDAALGNTLAGVVVSGSSGNTIGSAPGLMTSGYGNLISGNLTGGIDILTGSTGTLVLSNDIGTKAGGTGALGNGGTGVASAGSNTTIGGTDVFERNFIAGNAGAGVSLTGSSNLVQDNFIGIDATGNTILANSGDGVDINGGSLNTIAGTTLNAGNLISGNNGNGVAIFGGATNNRVADNIIGTDATGTIALGNTGDGVAISGAGTMGNYVGGGTTQNLISGNKGSGVDIFATATANLIAGNLIGINILGNAALGNVHSGVQILDASGNTVGSATIPARNVISGNDQNGVLIESDGASPAANNVIEANNIGTNPGGATAIPNAQSGIVIQTASNNTIGATVSGGGNIISGNAQGGVQIVATAARAATGNIVQNNSIGTDATGKIALGNGVNGNGIVIQDAAGNTVGGTAAGTGNLISGSSRFGILITSTGAAVPSNNLIAGNLIGTDVTGTVALGNIMGVVIEAGTGNTVGGTTAAARNVISGNQEQAVNIRALAPNPPTNTVVEGNYIGTDKNGTSAVPNGHGLFAVSISSANNTVGGTASGAQNVISGNAGPGIAILSDGTHAATGNVIAGNFIGVDATGAKALGNTTNGVELDDVSSNTVGGTTPAARNVISGNGAGVLVRASTGTVTPMNNLVEGNYIGTDSGGTMALGNMAGAGVEIRDAAGNTVGGTASGAGNLISANANGVLLDTGVFPSIATTNNVIAGNLIGTDATGTMALGNRVNGIEIVDVSGNTVGGTITAARNVIADSGVLIRSSGIAAPMNNLVEGNFIGTDAAGTSSLGTTEIGVQIQDGSSNTVGGTAGGSGNLISGNFEGVLVNTLGTFATTNNLIAGNLIGTDVTGANALGNSTQGVELEGVSGNIIGGTTTAARNVISANADGILIRSSGMTAATSNVIAGNFIGTDVTGMKSLGNSLAGISLANASGNTIGATGSGGGNIISGNMQGGVQIVATATPAATGNIVQNNSIGTDATGKIALGNGSNQAGVLIEDAAGNTVGGTASSASNLIAGNSGVGVSIATTGAGTPSNNVIAANLIGTDMTGAAKLGNMIGVEITAGSGNTVGGTTSAARNVISGNTLSGILISTLGTTPPTNTVIEGNYIGTDKNGASALGNGDDGVGIITADNTVGGTAAGAQNVISGNTGAGVRITSDGTHAATGNLIAGNFIGINAAGTTALGNTLAGVAIIDVSNTTVGGTSSAARNVISGNADGVLIGTSALAAPMNNLVEGNFIGTDSSGTAAVGNTSVGVQISAGSANTVGGAASGVGNVIAANATGVSLDTGPFPSIATTGNLIAGNFIGTDVTGTKALGNTVRGIRIQDVSANTVGGTSTAARNVISANQGEGIIVESTGVAPATGNLIEGNFIGTDATGLQPLGNALGGISLVNASSNTIGGTTAAAANLISGNGTSTQFEPGVALSVVSGGITQNNVIEGNLIGTDKTGLAPIGGSTSQSNFEGVLITNATSNTVGGTATGAGNTIAFNKGPGVNIVATTGSTGGTNQVLGNAITSNAGAGVYVQSPVGASLQTLIDHNTITKNTQNGVLILNANRNSITNNTISANTNDGVKVDGGVFNSILTNSIFDNTNLSIELVNGGNNNQSAPVLTTASASGGMTTIMGTLQAAAATTYRIQFFSSPASNPPGFGEAESFLGETTVTTTGPGPVSFTATVPVAVAANQFLTATATDQGSNNTSQVSETSPNLLLTLTAAPDPVNQTQDLTYTINLSNVGASPIAAITVTDTLPAGVTFLSATGGVTPVGNVLTFPAVDLNRGASLSTPYTIVVRADTAGTISNTATATYTNESDNPPVDPTTLTKTIMTRVNPVAHLVLTAAADPNPVFQGANLTLTDTVVNNGPSPSAGVTLTDTLPPSFTFVSATGGVTPAGNVLTFNLGTIAANATATVTIVVQPTVPGQFTNTAQVTSTTTDLNPVNNSASVRVTVLPAFIITNTNDSGLGSLRQVIQNVNASTNPAAINVGVQIPGPGPDVIHLTAALPAITHAMILDATPATGFTGTASLVVDGSMIPAPTPPANVAQTHGLFDVNAPGVVLKGLTISGFGGFGVVLDTMSGNDVIAADNIGTNVNGTAVVEPNTVGGVLVLSKNNTVGGTSAQTSNVISGNPYGVYLSGSGATGNQIIGNLIGTDRTGSNILGNNAIKVDGIEVDGASGNTIGGTTSTPGTAPGNLIEGYQAGIYLFGGASGNVIQGNAIRANGISTAGNSGQELGAILLTNASGNTITNNDLSGNTGSGVVLFNGAMGNTVTGNAINRNTSSGVYVFNAASNTIGGSSTGAGNTIMGNSGSGVVIQGSNATGNVVLANSVEGSGLDGIYIFNAAGNTIGGSSTGAGNTVENNGFSGVHIEGSPSTGNVVQGNTIANQSSGYGVLLENGATGNTIGGSGAAANSFQNNALGNIQVLVNGLPPANNSSAGNTIGGNNTSTTVAAPTPSLTTSKLHKHHPHPKLVKHTKGNHPHGPRKDLRKHHGR